MAKAKKKKADKPNIAVLIYGAAGSGKSIFASTFPKPLILDADGGHKIYEASGHFPDAIYIRGEKAVMTALVKAVEQIEEGTNKFETLVIDSITNLENIAKANMKYREGRMSGEDLYTSSGKKLEWNEWGNISGSTIALLTWLRDFPVNIVAITQQQTTYDAGKKKFVPQLTGKSSDEALHFPDIVGYLEKQASGKDGLRRVLHLYSSTSDNFEAKSRGLGNAPEPIVNPNYDKLIERVQNSELELNF